MTPVPPDPRSRLERALCLPVRPLALENARKAADEGTNGAANGVAAATANGATNGTVNGTANGSAHGANGKANGANGKAAAAAGTPPSEQSDWFWTYQEEPHRTRRMEILRAHPEATKLCGYEPLTKWVVLGVVATQFTCAFLLRNARFWSVPYLATAYIVGATANQNIFLSIHELCHNLGFKKPLHNRLFSIVANLPIGVPYSASFRPYHLVHHKHLGDTRYDTDLPTRLEAFVLQNVLGKAFFATFQILFYAIRPMCVMSMPFTWVHLLNVAVQLAVDAAVVRFWGWHAMGYLITSSFLAGSLHPCAGHFIAEHYVLDPEAIDANARATNRAAVPPPETYSYYGILNLFTYNVGLHNEHHDFPYVPWTRLPELTRLASEFYCELPYHTSWTKVIYDFVFEDKVSLWCRVRRGDEKKIAAAERTSINAIDRDFDVVDVAEGGSGVEAKPKHT
ncbi:fatty acid desaturase-domain-containing protein [Dipodascopsis tothii]|uniref:fatty acid desaturase-domain-containing protein n=1 Tax=Dipodascopsis tothii TaxID=44089 RepID=UPI0034CD4E06